MNKFNVPNNKFNTGYSLIEILVALALSSILLVGISKIFISSNKLSKISQGYTEIQESGRVGIQLISRDIRNADYWGCFKLNDDNAVLLDMLDKEDDDYEDRMSIYSNAISGANIASSFLNVYGHDNYGSGHLINNIPVKKGSDSLSLKGSTSPNQFMLDPPYMTKNTKTIHILPGAEIEQGERVLITDCSFAALFTNTAENTKGTGLINYTMQSLPADGVVDNFTDDIAHVFESDSQLLIPYSKVYFIGESKSINPSGGNGYSLYVMKDEQTAQELVRNVTDMQIEYGYGLEGSVKHRGTASELTALTWDDVLSITVTLDTESTSAVSSKKKTLTRSFTKTTNIRNRTL